MSDELGLNTSTWERKVNKTKGKTIEQQLEKKLLHHFSNFQSLNMLLLSNL